MLFFFLKTYSRFLLVIPACILISNILLAQTKEEFKMPSLDDGANNYPLEFSPDRDYPSIQTSYMIGTMDQDTMHFSVKDIGFDLLAFKVIVLSPQENEDLQVVLVKNHWKDIAKTGATRGGIFQDEFRTAGQFGIMIIGAHRAVPFRLAVYHGPVIKRTSSLFISTAQFKQDPEMQSRLANNETAGSQNDSGLSSNNPVLWIIAIFLLVIIALLIFLVLKKRNNTTTVLLLLLTLSPLLCSFVRPSTRQAFFEGMQKMAAHGGGLVGFAEKLDKLARGHGDFNELAGSDLNYEPDMDPNGQPSLPSSCLSASPSNAPGNRPGNRNEEDNRQANNDEDSRYDDSSYPSSGSSDRNTGGSGGSGSSVAITSPFDDSPPTTSQSTTPRLPKYDKNGVLQDVGDYPGAPITVPVDKETGEPILPVFLNGTMSTSSTTPQPRQPKYDKNGNLLDPGDYPGAPATVPLDPDTGVPMDPIAPRMGTSLPKPPRYDKDGNLTDPGDYADAPETVPLDPETGEPRIPDLSTLTQRGSGSSEEVGSGSGGAGSMPGQSGSGSPSGGHSGSGSGNSGGDNSDNSSEGCQCLQKAYANLEETRYKFEKLAVILNVTSKYVTASLALGDDVSGIHAVSGMAWQNERVKIVKSYDEFQEAYDNRYEQLIQELHDGLMQIDHCENLLGFENWYSIAGFMYYEFARARYLRNGR